MESCSHLKVTYRTVTVDSKGVVIGYWACDNCAEPFRPQKDAREFRERNYQLLQAAARILVAEGVVAVGTYERRLDSALVYAEYLLGSIELRNAPNVPIKNSGF